MPQAGPTAGLVTDPLRMLERVENSDGFVAVRDRLNRKASAATSRTHSQQQKYAKDIPDYLALNPLEASVMRANMKQQAVERCKLLHAGSDERCSSLVQKWIQDQKQISEGCDC